MLNFMIAQESFWRDEAFSMLVAIRQPLDIIITMAKDQSPPLYFLVLHYWIQIAGTSEAQVRLLSLLLHILSAGIFFLISRYVIKSLWGQFLATAAFLFNPFLVQYAYEARPYGLLVLLTLVSVYFLMRKWYFLSGIALSLSILTHNFALFNVAAIGLWWIMNNYKTIRQELVHGIELFLLPLLTVIGWGSIVMQQFQRVSGDFWITEKSPAMFKQFLDAFLKGTIWHKNNESLYFFALILLITGAATYFRKHTLSQWISLSLFLAIFPSFITFVISSLYSPIYNERYLIASVPFIFLLIAHGLEDLWYEHLWTKVFIVLSLVLYGFNLQLSDQQILDTYTKPAINWAVNQALTAAKPGDALVSEGYINYLETKWYSYKNSKGIPAYTVVKNGQVPYYIGTSVFDKGDILTKNPKNRTIWIIQEDGGFHKLESGK